MASPEKEINVGKHEDPKSPKDEPFKPDPGGNFDQLRKPGGSHAEDPEDGQK